MAEGTYVYLHTAKLDEWQLLSVALPRIATRLATVYLFTDVLSVPRLHFA